MTRKFLVAALAALAALPALADPNLATALTGRWGVRGSSNDFKLVGNTLYVADGNGLAVYDVTDAARISQITALGTDRSSIALSVPDDVFLLTEADVQQLEVRSDRSIVRKSSMAVVAGSALAASSEWLAVADDMTINLWRRSGDNLRFAGHFPLQDVATDMLIQDEHLYAAIKNEGIDVFELGGGTLDLLGVISTQAQGLALDGNNLYAAAGFDGLFVVDVHDPSAPVTRSRTGEKGMNLVRVAAAGGRAYGSEPDGHVVVFDLTPAAGPARIGLLDEPARAIAADSTRLFVAGSRTDQWGVESFTGVAVHAFDVTAAGLPVSAGQFVTAPGPLSGVATDGVFAYVADPPFFRVIRISNPDQPQEVTSLRIDGLQDHVRMQGQRVVVYGRGDVDFIDVSDPERPRLLSIWPSFGGAPSAAAFGRTTVLEGNSRSGFHVLDTTDPGNLVQISGSKGHYYEVQSFGDTAYIFDLGSMRVVDLRDPHNAIVVENLIVATMQVEFAAADSTHPALLAASTPDGLRLYDISDPLAPSEIGLVAVPGNGVFALGKDTAYYAVPGTLFEIDLTHPSAPIVRQTTISVASPRQVAIHGDSLTIADAYSLLVFGPPGPAPRHRAATHH
jgi:hypothetical protein